MNVVPTNERLLNTHNFGQIGCGTVVPFSRHSQTAVVLQRPVVGVPVTFIASGDSLIGRGIHDGDTLICLTNFRREDTIGRVCVVRCNGELLAKIVIINPDGSITLRSSNPRYSDRVLDADSVEVVAIVESIQRKV